MTGVAVELKVLDVGCGGIERFRPVLLWERDEMSVYPG